MINLNSNKVKMNCQNSVDRINNFEEVATGYSKKQALEEANRCLNCVNKPCVSKCPVKINIPGFIEQVRLQNFQKSFEIIYNSSLLSAVCGRVCPQELQCESACVRKNKGESVAIGNLERFVSDWQIENATYLNLKIKKNGKKVAVVGSGPAGLTCAGELVKLGFDVWVFEALHVVGGVLAYGIPKFRLPQKVVDYEINLLKNLGVHFKTNVLIGHTLTLNDLFKQNFCAVFIGVGAGLPRVLNIEGENLNGVFYANEFLTRINLMKAYEKNSQTPIHRAKKFVVLGGGNVAIDVARCAKRLGKNEVVVAYRRGEAQMPARLDEIKHAKEEGIIFKTFCAPIKFCDDGNGFLKKIKFVETYFEKNQNGVEKLMVKKNSEFDVDASGAVIAIGTIPNPLIQSENFNLKVNEKGLLVVNENTLETSNEKVFAGGDIVSGTATVISAIENGKKAAKSIYQKFFN